MKTYKAKFIIAVVFLAGLFTACDETKDVSVILDVPMIEWTNEIPQFISVDLNSTFTEVIPRGFSGGAEVEVERAGSLPDTSTPGLYRIAYKVFASETFYRTYFRYVNVRDFSTIASDLSGEYHNSPDAITITKIYDGFYTASDTWWQPAGPIPVTFYDCGNGEFLIIEPQSSIFGPVYNDGFSYYTTSPATIEFNLGIPSQGAYYTTLWTK